MSLFNLLPFKKSAETVMPSPVISEGKADFVLIKTREKLEAKIGKIALGKHYHYVSRSHWSTHDLVAYLLEQTGPAKVYMTTWSISEDPARKLFLMLQSGMIQELHCILDYRAKTQYLNAYQLLSNQAVNIHLTKCHAKVTVIENDQWQVSLNCSANWNNNCRIEAGVICTLPEVAAMHKKWIMAVINETQPLHGAE